MRSTLILIGVSAFVLVSCAGIPTSQEANDALLASATFSTKNKPR
jgi:hypothetical protein